MAEKIGSIGKYLLSIIFRKFYDFVGTNSQKKSSWKQQFLVIILCVSNIGYFTIVYGWHTIFYTNWPKCTHFR